MTLNAKRKATKDEGISSGLPSHVKILTRKQMLQRFPNALA